jgi:hypothetical protein
MANYFASVLGQQNLLSYYDGELVVSSSIGECSKFTQCVQDTGRYRH